MATSSDGGKETSIVRPFLISLAATLVFVAIVLVSAGRFSVWQAWVYAGFSLALNLGQRMILRGNPAREGTREARLRRTTFGQGAARRRAAAHAGDARDGRLAAPAPGRPSLR